MTSVASLRLCFNIATPYFSNELPSEATVCRRSGHSASATYEVENQRDHREDQQNVNQPTGDVKHTQPEQPCHEQDHKQDRKDTHNLTSDCEDYVRCPPTHMGRYWYSREKGTADRWRRCQVYDIRHRKSSAHATQRYAATHITDRTSAQSYASAPNGGAVPDFRFDPYWAEAWLLKRHQRAPEFRATLSKVPC